MISGLSTLDAGAPVLICTLVRDANLIEGLANVDKCCSLETFVVIVLVDFVH
jgi:hypothetical protein